MIQADASGRFVLHVDLGLDRIFVWKFDADRGVPAYLASIRAAAEQAGVDLKGFKLVDEERLRALPDPAVLELHRNGIEVIQELRTRRPDLAILAFTAGTSSFTETNSTNNTLTLTVVRTGTTNNACTVSFTTTNVSAVAGSDYAATNGTISFAAGTDMKIPVALLCRRDVLSTLCK